MLWKTIRRLQSQPECNVSTKCIGLLLNAVATICAGCLGSTSLVGLSGGLGYGQGQISGRRSLVFAEWRLDRGQYSEAAYEALLGIRLLLDSEIRWNAAQPYVRQYRILSQQGKYPEALKFCTIARQLLEAYDRGEVIGDCFVIERKLEKP
jgi:hypothetical protein